MARIRESSHSSPGSRVSFMLAGQEVLGTVIEDRGGLGVGGRTVLRVQMDPSGSAELHELEAPASELAPRPMKARERKALEDLLSRASSTQRVILDTALHRFHTDLRHRTLGLWPEDLALSVNQRLERGGGVSNEQAAEALHALARLGLVAKRPSGMYISTDWLLRYLDETTPRSGLKAAG